MKATATDKMSSFSKKPRIKKGYYPGKLVGVKGLNEKDGTPKVGLYGKQWILEFQVFQEDKKTPITVTEKVEGSPDKTIDLILPYFVHYEYKDFPKGKTWDGTTFKTAITAEGKVTKVFQALGWKFALKADLDTDLFIGGWVELNIDDYDVKDKNADGTEKETYKASSIEDVKALEEGSGLPKPVSSIPAITQATKDLQKAKLDQHLLDGNITQEGYDLAIKQLNATPVQG